jgi:apolipoprotein N-acyltransferase
VGVAICYEIAFGEPLRAALPDAAFLVTVANDSWFDGTPEPAQHLDMARMRALESGRWLLRAALSGHTAIVAPSGAIVRRLPPGRADVLEGEITPRTGATPYVRWGSGPLLLLCGAVLSIAAAHRVASGSKFLSRILLPTWIIERHRRSTRVQPRLKAKSRAYDADS